MNKSYYFSHDYTAAEDIKILYLRQSQGIAGYGAYWFLIEKLAIAGGKLPIKIIPMLAIQIGISKEDLKQIIEAFELFIIDGEIFYSQRLINTLNIRNELSEKGKENANKRWNEKTKPNEKKMVL